MIGTAEKTCGFPEGAKDPVSDLSVRGDNRLLASEAADINGESEDAQKSESSDPDPCHVSEGEENFVGDSEIIALGGASNETKDRPLG